MILYILLLGASVQKTKLVEPIYSRQLAYFPVRKHL